MGKNKIMNNKNKGGVGNLSLSYEDIQGKKKLQKDLAAIKIQYAEIKNQMSVMFDRKSQIEMLIK